MTYSLAAASVSAAASVATFNLKTTAAKNETSSQAINIGNLTEESSIVTVSDQGQQAGSPVSSTFTTQTGDVTSLSAAFDNVVNAIDTRVQLFDSNGDLIADNQGNDQQLAQYEEWAGNGLSLAGGTYTAVATPISTSTASLSTTQNQGTSLQVNSQLTGSDATEFYNFDFTAGNNMKLAFDAGTQSPSVRVQLLNSSGAVVADSEGNPYEKANYLSLTSGTGLTASTGQYTVEVSYANGVNPDTISINYNFQLYSGSNYAVVYHNTVNANPTDTTAIGSATATAKALLYTRSDYNQINELPSAAVNIGWLSENQSALDVVSQLTSADNSDYYSFTLQKGNNLKFGFVTGGTPTPNDLRVQILNSTGEGVIADSQGTAAQQAAYQQLTTTDGLSANPGNYLVKVSYANNAPKTTQNYEFQVLSGTSYNALYKSYASAQTYANALLTGNAYTTTASSGMAAYMTALANGDNPDIIGALSTSA